MSEAKQGIVKQFTKHGRTVTGVHDVSLRDEGGVLGTLAAFTGGTLAADRYEIVTATGPLGPECVVIPFDGHAVLPGEYHLTLHGALRSPVEFLRRRGGTWHAGQDEELAKWMKSQKFPTFMLPDELKQGFTKVQIEQMLQLFPIGLQHSALVFTLGGNHADVQLKPYLELVEKLAPAIAGSAAPGPLAPLGEIRFGALVAAAHAGELDVRPGPAGSSVPAPATAAVDAPAGESSVPADTALALRSVLEPMLDDRVLIPPIADKTLGNIAKKILKGESVSAVIGFLDSGLRASGKAGWAFTEATLHISTPGRNWTIRYDDIRSFEPKKSDVVVMDTRNTGVIECVVSSSIQSAAVTALEAVTGLSAT